MPFTTNEAMNTHRLLPGRRFSHFQFSSTASEAFRSRCSVIALKKFVSALLQRSERKGNVIADDFAPGSENASVVPSTLCSRMSAPTIVDSSPVREKVLLPIVCSAPSLYLLAACWTVPVYTIHCRRPVRVDNKKGKRSCHRIRKKECEYYLHRVLIHFLKRNLLILIVTLLTHQYCWSRLLAI